MRRARRPKRSARFAPVLIAGTLAVTAIALWLLTVFEGTRTGYLALLSTIFAAMFPLATVGYQRRATAERARQSADEILRQTADRLCLSVKENTEELRRHLQVRADFMDVTWETVRPPAGEVPAGGGLADLVTAFQLLPARQRRLVILGAPASGKTVYAAALVLEILKSRRGGAGMIPVLLRFALRDKGTDRDLVDWIAKQIETQYAGAMVREALFGTGPHRIVPILDGLDEVGPLLLPDALAELNESLRDAAPLVVICRSDFYREVTKANGDLDIKNAWVIELQPLGEQAIEDYLGADGSWWQPVITELRRRPATPLFRVLRNPFNTWLAKRLYQPSTDPNSRPDELVGTDARTVQHRLLERFIPSVMNPDKRRHPEQVLDFTVAGSDRWLRFLARYLRRGGAEDLAWWDLRRTITPIVVELAVGMVAGAGFGFALLAMGDTALGIGLGAAYGVLFGFAFCLAYTSTWRRGDTSQRVGGGGFRDVPEPSVAARRLAEGMIVVATAWLVALALVATTGELRSLVIGGVGETVSVVCLGALIALLFGAGVGRIAALLLRVMTSYRTLATVRATTPHDALTRDRRATVVCFVMFAVVIGLLTGCVLVVVSADAQVVALAAVGGGAAGGATGATMFFAWPSYLVRHAWLSLSRRLPWRFMTFLRVARDAGVLRQSGAHYQFRHRILRDHLAE